MERINFTEEQGFAIRELQISSYRRGLITGVYYSILSLAAIFGSVYFITYLHDTLNIAVENLVSY